MTSCIQKPLVDAHFEGTIDPPREARLRAHLRTCASCTDYYARRLLLARLDPAAPSMEERLARGLGLSAADTTERAPASRPNGRRARAIVLAIVAAAAVVLFVVLARRPRDDGFAARGGPPSTAPYVRIYRAAAGAAPIALEGSIRPDDELAFGYESVPDKGALMIFGIDEHGHVFWYYPAWTDPSDDPSSIAVERDPKLHLLHEATAHDLDGKTLEIHALFSDRPLGVRAVERLLGGTTAPRGPLVLPGTTDVVSVIEVRR